MVYVLLRVELFDHPSTHIRSSLWSAGCKRLKGQLKQSMYGMPSFNVNVWHTKFDVACHVL